MSTLSILIDALSMPLETFLIENSFVKVHSPVFVIKLLFLIHRSKLKSL